MEKIYQLDIALELSVIAKYNVVTSSKDKDILEDVWHCCNVDCWNDKHERTEIKSQYVSVYPTNCFSGVCNSDIVVELNGKYYIALKVGWKEVKDLTEAKDILIENKFII